MANIRDFSALGGKKKAGISADMKSEATVQQPMQKREEEDCTSWREQLLMCSAPGISHKPVHSVSNC